MSFPSCTGKVKLVRLTHNIDVDRTINSDNWPTDSRMIDCRNPSVPTFSPSAPFSAAVRDAAGAPDRLSHMRVALGWAVKEGTELSPARPPPAAPPGPSLPGHSLYPGMRIASSCLLHTSPRATPMNRATVAVAFSPLLVRGLAPPPAAVR